MPGSGSVKTISKKFYDWLSMDSSRLAVFNALVKLQDRYMQEQGTSSHGLRGVSTEKLRELQTLHDNRLANVREELRRRGA